VSRPARDRVWELRRSGELSGGVRLLVLLTLADSAAERRQHSVKASVRYLSDRCGVSTHSVVSALRHGVELGLIECDLRGYGTAPSRWHFVVPSTDVSTASPQAVDNGPIASQESSAAGEQRCTSESQRRATTALALHESNNYPYPYRETPSGTGSEAVHSGPESEPEPELFAQRMAALRASVGRSVEQHPSQPRPTL
jgi:hypothetical protein